MWTADSARYDAWPPEVLALSLAGYFGFALVLTSAVFAIEKQRAVLGERQVPEATLLFWRWPGAKLAQRLLDHGTRKQPFGAMLNLVGVTHSVLLTALLLPASVTGGAALQAAERAGNLMVETAREVAAMTTSGGEDDKAALPKGFGPGAD